MKIYLNEEIARLKKELENSLLIKEFVEDNKMGDRAKEVLSVLESYKEQKPDKEMIRQIMKIQSLTHEIQINATD